MNLKRIELPAPIEPLVQDWKGISTEIGHDGLVHVVLVDLDVYESVPEPGVNLNTKGTRVTAYNRTGPHFDVQRSNDGLRGFEGDASWTREAPGAPREWRNSWTMERLSFPGASR